MTIYVNNNNYYDDSEMKTLDESILWILKEVD